MMFQLSDLFSTIMSLNDIDLDDDKKRGGKLLWDVARDTMADKDTKESLPTDLNVVLVVGSRSGGKTSMILKYLERTNETPKSTAALEYNYAKKPKGIDTMGKDVGHVWELGDGTFLIKLIDVVITPETIDNASIVLVLDLSQPKELYHTFQTVVEYLMKRIKTCISDAVKKNAAVKDKLKKAFERRLGDFDRNQMDPMRIPFLIIGSKYDIFQYYSEKQEAVVHLKSMFNHFLFDTELSNKPPQLDYNKPIYVKCGTDTSDQIGPPPIPEYELGDIREKSPTAVWRAAFCKHFPQEVEQRDPTLLKDYGNDPQYADQAVDAMKEQKMAVRYD
ncbi:unnamed protein product [Didymodactylos carnosus]|uniref:Cytoplasmic dynein 2 light intermediate chain 1 n=1 Tax=Didymodactylos carnosus TaxID=1234261 RepID=A0A8S2GEA0_9BILA|nr:unnamed protein product [Didymodactylos carnosus]CAF3501640.1 unnamed protein product [Didymodactylos carnosus]